jgi:hypothetical protein
MNEIETNFVFWFIGILLAVIAFVGALGVNALIKIAASVNKMEKDLSVLTNDHSNLKEEVREVKHRVLELEKV